MEYLDFDLHIGQGSGPDYPVTVLKSPVGEASATLRFPFEAVALESQLQKLELAVLRAGTPRRDAVMVAPEQDPVVAFGKRLFEALFIGEVQLAFRRSQDRARSEHKGLRVRLHIDAPGLSALSGGQRADGRPTCASAIRDGAGGARAETAGGTVEVGRRGRGRPGRRRPHRVSGERAVHTAGPDGGRGGDQQRAVNAGRIGQDTRASPGHGRDPGRFVHDGLGHRRGRTVSQRGADAHGQRVAFALGKSEVTVEQFQAYADDPRNRSVAAVGCSYWNGTWATNPNWNWRSPRFEQTGKDPVVCVSWEDAQRFVRWLSQVSQASYRLPSEAEWEYAARASTTGPRYWDQLLDTCRYANVDHAPPNCDDGYEKTAPGDRPDLVPNAFGLYDMLGNVMEWTADCANSGYLGGPVTGDAWIAGNCASKMARGGAWIHGLREIRSAYRVSYSQGFRANMIGFRVAKTP